MRVKINNSWYQLCDFDKLNQILTKYHFLRCAFCTCCVKLNDKKENTNFHIVKVI